MAGRSYFAAAKYRKVNGKQMQTVRRFAVYCRENTKEALMQAQFPKNNSGLLSFTGMIWQNGIIGDDPFITFYQPIRRQANQAITHFITIKIFNMKKLYFLSLLTLIALFILPDISTAQKFSGLDKSPADIALYPARGADKAIKVIYSRPQKNDREIFGKLEAYGKVWRAGANECTEITLYKDVQLGGKSLKAGTYSLFAIPNEKSWTIIFNSELNQWGAYSYKESADVLRFDVPTQKAAQTIEAFSIAIEKSDAGADMYMGWDDTVVKVPFAFK